MEYDNAQQNMAYAAYYPMYSQLTADGQYLYFTDFASALAYQFQHSYANPQYSGPLGDVTVPGVVYNQNATFNPQANGGFATEYAKPLSPVVEDSCDEHIAPPRLGLQDFSSSESNTAISAA